MHSILPLGLLVGALPLAATTVTNEARTHNTPRTFTPAQSRADWDARATDIRQQALVSCGLWPMPEKTPLNARIFGRIEREDYTIEKVAFQSWPGFYVGGNLYRPRGKGNGPFPGVLNPHGHWANGRLTDVKDGSIPARCINFAKQGMIALAIDMVGYNDTMFANHPHAGQPGSDFGKRHRLFATNAVCQLWGISLMGLQTWNSIRALDFLESLPDVDRKRLGCTGASGGGTQTFMLGVVDNRLAVQAPVCMVSHSMQGGCSCENAPGLRVKYSNMDLAAAAAPRPQILVAATGDWTKDTPTVEGPAVGSVYQLLGAPDRLRYVRFDAGHNYNQTGREAVYAWLDRWLLNQPDVAAIPEQPYIKESDQDLRVWPDDQPPADTISDEQLIARLIEQRCVQLAAVQPRRKRDFEEFRKVMLPLWRHTLQVEWPGNEARLSFKPVRAGGTCSALEFEIRRGEEAGAIAAVYFRPNRIRTTSSRSPRLVLLAHEQGAQRYCDADQNPQGLASALIKEGCPVIVITQFSAVPAADPFANFYTTYNRTVLQQRVRDVLAVCASVGGLTSGGGVSPRLVLCGEGRAGLWTLLAAPAAHAVVADWAGANLEADQALLAEDLFCPGFRSLGAFDTAALLAAPHPLVLHNTGGGFTSDGIRRGYRALNVSRRLEVQAKPASPERILRWLTEL